MGNDAKYFQYLLEQVLELMDMTDMKDHPKALKLVRAAIYSGNARILEYVAKKLSPLAGIRKLEATEYDPLPDDEALKGNIEIGTVPLLNDQPFGIDLIDLAVSPHLLLIGVSRAGKTNLIISILQNLEELGDEA